jgi:hypothetical protein
MVSHRQEHSNEKINLLLDQLIDKILVVLPMMIKQKSNSQVMGFWQKLIFRIGLLLYSIWSRLWLSIKALVV